VRGSGGIASLSVDAQAATGAEVRDFLESGDRAWGLAQLRALRPLVLGLSPPCTMFSIMQQSNKTKIKDMSRHKLRCDAAGVLLCYSMVMEAEFCMALIINNPPPGSGLEFRVGLGFGVQG